MGGGGQASAPRGLTLGARCGGCMRYVVAPKGWCPENVNPFSTDGAYNPGWSCFSLKGGPGRDYFSGRSRAGCWLLRLGTGARDLEQRLVDFISYENHHGRTAILDFPGEIHPEDFLTRATEKALGPSEWRPSDPEYVVHSTALRSWEKIRAHRLMKAASRTESRPLPARGGIRNEIDDYLSEEPPEYREYIMFGSLGSVSEMILASYTAGKFQLVESTPYTPGARLYFDNRRIVTDGRCTRDGLHSTKVYGSLPLQGYLLFSVTAKDLAYKGSPTAWTPRSFSERADQLFADFMSGRPRLTCGST